ncbi:MAG: SufD family Fe-S cluster assembly protein [Candidatus Thermoplasmatota archaeon]|nr:SufD family Fe-S cluster assembly protein [Candidatus Thermoplasmatota archaeon]
MTSYLDATVPSRSEHLWRYTPWSRVHPGNVNSIPEVDPVVFESEEFVLSQEARQPLATTDIARIFLNEVLEATTMVDCDGKQGHIHIHAGGHAVAAHLHFSCKTSSQVVIHLHGEADWFGLALTGDVHANAQLSVGIINELSADSVMVRVDDWSVHRDAQFELATLSMGGHRNKSDIRSTLEGSNASLKQFIAVHGHGTRHDDHHVEIHHQQPHTNSHLLLNAACDDRSHSIGTGALTIDDIAQHTDAGQVFRNLLLSPSSRAEAIPELEVLANEVAAAHGAASAPINEEQLHYLMSRGLSKQEATSMIVEGFLIDSFTGLDSDFVRDAIQTRLTVHLECQLLG